MGEGEDKLRDLLEENQRLQALLKKQASAVAMHEKMRAERDAAVEQVEALQRKVSKLEEHLESLVRRAFSRSSEKLDPKQLLLFAEHGVALETDPEGVVTRNDLEPDAEEPLEAPPKKKRRAESRPILPSDAETRIVEHPVEDRACRKCGEEMETIGTDDSEMIEYVPARLIREIHRREKVACKQCEECVDRGPAAARVLHKGQPGPAVDGGRKPRFSGGENAREARSGSWL